MKKWIYSGTREEQPSERELMHGKLARKAASEGIVLLKNEGILPLKKDTAVALLGYGAEKTVKGGIGSGDVNNRKNISIYQGLKEAGVKIVSEDWISDYHNRYEQAREAWKEKVLEEAKKVDNPFDAYAENPFAMPLGRKVAEEDICEADVVIYVISRISGEGKDRRKVKGDYYLSEREEEDLRYLAEMNKPVILILNAGGPVELTDILEQTDNIKGILNISQLGQEGGDALADVLLGKEVPGGKLTTTWARRYEDYPASEEYGYLNGNLEKEKYKEGIYVGYRYFDSFDKKVMFPFGFGLSYTMFEMKCCSINMEESKIRAEVQVTNTGNEYAGKEVVQIYVTLPQTELEKEYKRLAGFAKTRLLKPGETQTLTVEIPQKQLASFNEETHTWIVEKGKYGILVGNSSDKLKLEAVLVVSDDTVLEQMDKICPLQEELEQIYLTKELKEKSVQRQEKLITAQVPEYYFKPAMIPAKSENAGKNQENLTEEEKRFVSVLEDRTTEELIPLLYGKISENISTLGAAGIRVPGSAGETCGTLEEYGIPSLVMADGPAGIRLRQWYEVDKETESIYEMGVLGSLENGILEPGVHHENADTYYQYCTAFPVGTALAQTWDTDLMTEFGKAIAEEMEEFHVNLWLAPGMNIHRNPLCGRNYEYYSEDPYLSGMLAAAVIRGVQSKSGCGVTIKHFACNNQEDNRMGVDSCVSERALREIYLRGFEIAVKEGNPVSIMTSYNLINGIHAANSKDLCMTVARKEWGFDGAIMSDWNTTVPEDGSVPWKCVAAGNDIIMPGNPDDECGRNYEYYSEDPYLSGMLAAAVIRGVQSKSGCGVTIKHFACNNQEDNRMGVDSCVSERALREIYLRGFEIAVKEGNPVSIMTSYNLINGIHAANSKDLCMTVARKEWGFDGAIMSDWNTTVPEDGSVPWKCVAAGNDIIMPGNPDDDKNIRQAYKEGKLTEEEIRNCAGHLVSMIRRLESTDC